jgi:hypothetical protein
MLERSDGLSTGDANASRPAISPDVCRVLARGHPPTVAGHRVTSVTAGRCPRSTAPPVNSPRSARRAVDQRTKQTTTLDSRFRRSRAVVTERGGWIRTNVDYADGYRAATKPGLSRDNACRGSVRPRIPRGLPVLLVAGRSALDRAWPAGPPPRPFGARRSVTVRSGTWLDSERLMVEGWVGAMTRVAPLFR